MSSITEQKCQNVVKDLRSLEAEYILKAREVNSHDSVDRASLRRKSWPFNLLRLFFLKKSPNLREGFLFLMVL